MMLNKVARLVTGAKNKTTSWILFVAGMAAYTINIGHNGYGYLYISAPVRSMHYRAGNLLDITYDAGGIVGVDKAPVALWLQYLSTKIMGFNALGLHLPSAVCGAISAVVLKNMVTKAHGKTAGILSGCMLLLTPGFLAVSRSNAVDVVCIMLVLLGLNAYMSAQTGNVPVTYKRIILSGTLIGLGFMTKMWAATFVLPALVLYTVLKNRATTETLKRVGALLGSAIALPGLWIGQAMLRSGVPYVTSSGNGNVLGLIWGHNGPGRVLGFNLENEVLGMEALGPTSTIGSVGKFLQFGGPVGILRLFNTNFGDQNMWFAALAAVGAATILTQKRTPVTLTLVLGGWVTAVYLVLSYASYGTHIYYSSAIAPGIAGVAGITAAHIITHAKRLHLLAATAVWAATNLLFVTRVDNYLLPIAGTAGAVLAAGAVAITKTSKKAHLSLPFVLLSVAPAFWAYSGITNPQRNAFPDARPLTVEMRQIIDSRGTFQTSPRGGGFPGENYDQRVGDWLKTNQGNATWMAATYSATQSSEWVVNGYTLLPLGGVFGGDRIASLQEVNVYIEQGKLRYFLVPDDTTRMGPGLQVTGILTAAKEQCPAVDGIRLVNEQVYDCREIELR